MLIHVVTVILCCGPHGFSDGYLALPTLPSLWRGGIEDRPSFECAPTLDSETDSLRLSHRVAIGVSLVR
jgi:hypothetical protein